MSTHKVLIVDDNESTLQLFRLVVGKLDDAEPVLFTSPEQALIWSAGIRPSLVVCDQLMPGTDGLKFLEMLRLQPGNGDVPVIMVTAVTEREVKREALRRGVAAFLSKPVDPVEFMAYAKNLLAQGRSHAELLERVASLSNQLHKQSDAGFRTEAASLEALLISAKLRDPALETHVRRAARIGELVARRMRLSQHDLELFSAAAPFYDIGKLSWPDRILTSRARVDPRDQNVVVEHTTAGAEVLRGTTPLRKAAAEMAEMHHERHDGSGYPHKLKGDAIPLFARIIGIADVYIAMTSPRRYRDAISPGIARGEIERGSGSRFDPRAVAGFLAATEEIDQEVATYAPAVPMAAARVLR